MDIAVITGASSGMGKDFALALDRQQHFDEIWLIARRKERLDDLSKDIEAKTRIMQIDLGYNYGIEQYGSILKEVKPNICVLVNAAGFGHFKAFEKDDMDSLLNMIDVNDKALVAITYMSLKYMKEGACIYQLGSMSSWQPVPYMSIYAASKAFVVSFTRSLNEELKERKIKAMAVCPGWVKTEFFETAKTDDTVTYYNRWRESKDVVELALKDMKRGKDVSILGFGEKLQRLLVKLMPVRFTMKVWCKQQKH